MELLKIDRIGKSFGGLRALNDVSFDVQSGETLGLMGANGAGKTTLFSIIAGHQKPTDGSIWLRGALLNGRRPDQICHAGIARTFQIVRPFAQMSVRENVETAILFGKKRRDNRSLIYERALHILEQIGMADQAELPSASLTLSGRKKLEVARALGTSPEILLLDEVMAGLTPTEVGTMLETLHRIKANNHLTIIIIEHVVQALSDLSDRIIVLHHGEKIAEGSPSKIAEDRNVRAVYFGEDET